MSCIVEQAQQQRGWWTTVNPMRGGVAAVGYVELQRNNMLIVCKFDGEEMTQAVRYKSDSGPWKAQLTATGLWSSDMVERWIA